MPDNAPLIGIHLPLSAMLRDTCARPEGLASQRHTQILDFAAAVVQARHQQQLHPFMQLRCRAAVIRGQPRPQVELHRASEDASGQAVRSFEAANLGCFGGGDRWELCGTVCGPATGTGAASVNKLRWPAGPLSGSNTVVQVVRPRKPEQALWACLRMLRSSKVSHSLSVPHVSRRCLWLACRPDVAADARPDLHL